MSKSISTRNLLIGAGVLLLLWKRVGNAATQFAKKFAISDVKLSNVRPGLARTRITLSIVIANFNPLPVTVTGARFDLLVNGAKVGSILNQQGGTISANSSSTLEGDVTVSTLALGNEIWNLVKGGSLSEAFNSILSINITVVGEVFGAGGITVPVNQTVRPI